jgi:VIT1/CCC1 family predicted Fe2+/Mn2+ transporter
MWSTKRSISKSRRLKYRDYVEVPFPAQAGMVLATLTGSIILIVVSYVAMAGCSPFTATTTTTGLATATVVVE